MAYKQMLSSYQQRINQYLQKILEQQKIACPTLQAAMQYSLLAPGKRLRAAIVYSVAALLDITNHKLIDDIAASLELIHCYSLIHDDLPAMDDDDLRRGIPTCHKQFNEATAILAGDALHTLAFEVLANTQNQKEHAIRLQLVTMLAKNAGASGMIGGQSLDLAAENKELSLDELNQVHNLKTGALITAAFTMPTRCVSLTATQGMALASLGKNLGLIFQIQDDILDVTQASSVLGKTQGSDLKRNAATYPRLLGLDKSQSIVNELYAQAMHNMQNFKTFLHSELHALCEYLYSRNY